MLTAQGWRMSVRADIARRRDEGLEMLRRYIASHAFIHDDHWPGEIGDFDELSGHPLLYEAPLVVSSRSGGEVQLAKEALITTGISALADLSGSSEAIDHVARKIADQRLDISGFYTDRAEFSALCRRVSSFGYETRLHPSPSLFRTHSSHNSNAKLLGRFEGFPTTRSVSDFEQTRVAFHQLNHGDGVFVKRADSRTVKAQSADEAWSYASSEGVPVLLQESRDKLATAVFQWIQDGSSARPLFVSLQIESSSHHVGNVYNVDYESEFFDRFEELTNKWMELVPTWVGPIAVDAIVPVDGTAPIAIDLNARFNSSTVPISLGLLGGSHADIEYRRWDGPSAFEATPNTIEFGKSAAATDTVYFSVREALSAEGLAALGGFGGRTR